MSDEKEELYYALAQAAARLRKEHGVSLFKLIEKITETDKEPAAQMRKLFYKLKPIFAKTDTLEALADQIHETANRVDEAADQLPQKPTPPIGSIRREHDILMDRCRRCGSSLELKLIFFAKNGGCINPRCERFHERAIASRRRGRFLFPRKIVTQREAARIDPAAQLMDHIKEHVARS